MESAADQRDEMLDRWEHAAAGWSRRADAIQEFGMRVAVWMLEHLALQPGQRVLDLACGPGDTGFLAAELVKPGGTLIASDASRGMLGVATGRARDLGVTNVEFKQIELEWIDLPTASVDAALCRWGLMFTLDPSAAAQEIRRVVRPGGRIAVAVWAGPEENPWATLPPRALVELGHAQPPDPTAPGMFALADPERLSALLENAGLTEVVVDAVDLVRTDPDLDAYLEATLDVSSPFAEVWEGLSGAQREQVRERLAELARPFLTDEGGLSFPARSVVAAANA